MKFSINMYKKEIITNVIVNFKSEAGTGEGIKITSSRSARNADKLE